jgi:hypothetical protein
MIAPPSHLAGNVAAIRGAVQCSHLLASSALKFFHALQRRSGHPAVSVCPEGSCVFRVGRASRLDRIGLRTSQFPVGSQTTASGHRGPPYQVRRRRRNTAARSANRWSSLRSLRLCGLCVNASLRATSTSPPRRSDTLLPLAHPSCGWRCRVNAETAEIAERAEKARLWRFAQSVQPWFLTFVP